MRSPYQRPIILTMILLVLVSPVLADMGTALMALEYAHLYFLNFIIAGIETLVAYLLLRFAFRMPRSRLYGWILMANIVSVGVGFFVLPEWVFRMGDRILGEHPLANLPTLMLATFLLTFVLTVLIEWPFVHIGVARWIHAEENAGRRWKTRLPAVSFITNLVIQVVSYAGLAYLYFAASNTFLVSEVKIAHTPAFVKTPQAIVYYERLDAKGYNRIRLDGSRPERVTLTKKEFEKKVRDYYGNEKLRTVVINPAIDFRPVSERQIEIWEDEWGRIIIDDHHITRTCLSLEIPYFQWYTGYPTALPGDQLVFQIGNEIVVYDIHTRQLFELAPGYNPIVFIPGVKYQPSPPEVITPP